MLLCDLPLFFPSLSSLYFSSVHLFPARCLIRFLLVDSFVFCPLAQSSFARCRNDISPVIGVTRCRLLNSFITYEQLFATYE